MCTSMLVRNMPLLLGVLALMPHAGFAQLPTMLRGPVCHFCRLSLGDTIVLGSEQDPAGPMEVSHAVRDSRGRYFVAPQ